MKSKFDFHRQYIVSEVESAIEIMEKYPFLKQEAVVGTCTCVHDVLAYSLIRSWS